MRRLSAGLAIVALGLGFAPSSTAQDRQPMMAHFGIGASLPQGDTRDFLDDGWALHGGATWFSPSRPNWGLRMDIGVDWWDVDSALLSTIDTDSFTPFIQPPDDGDARAWSGTLDLVWNPVSNGKIGFYVPAGVGIYYASWDLSQDGVVPSYWCDWWWGVCYPTLVSGEYIIQDGESWEWGANAGVGITIQMTTGQLYFEGVYHWVDTEQAAEFLPVTVGFRW